jgi:putative FmdB family regulatory protein
MPIYEWLCKACNKSCEQMQTSFEPAAPLCECGAYMVLQIAPSVVVFSGKGWAKKDRKDKKNGRR